MTALQFLTRPRNSALRPLSPRFWRLPIPAVVLLLLSLAGFCSPTAGQNTQESPRQGLLVVGYIPEYRIDKLDPDVGASVTDLIFFSIEPTETGELNTRRLTPQALQKLTAMRERYKNRLLVTLGGWGRSRAFAKVASDAELRSRFVRSLTQFCLDNHLDGADFDWEHPANQAENDAYAALLSATKEAFRPKRLLVTVALAGWQDQGATAYAAVDRIHLMAYDHQGERHSTFEQGTDDVKKLVARGVPEEKLCLGLPFYGRGMTNRRMTMTYAEIVKRYQPDAGADEAGEVYSNGVNTIQRKTRYAKENGLGGVMVWELGQDTDGQTSLLRAIRAAGR